jgi:hypothetical protein
MRDEVEARQFLQVLIYRIGVETNVEDQSDPKDAVDHRHHKEDLHPLI